MDLDYPSEKHNNLSVQLNNIDSRYGSIILSNPKVGSSKNQLTCRLKNKVLNLIEKDDQSLLFLMEDNDITLIDEISKAGLGWTILHYISKYNSVRCLDVCLKNCYQEDQESYQKILNARNNEGDTPLLMACQFKSNDVIKIILGYGGADIYLINSRKHSAYQLALSSGNEEILQALMKYQLKVKRRNSVNNVLLSQPIKLKRQPQCWVYFFKIWECLCCDRKVQEQLLKETQTDRKIIKSEIIPKEIYGQLEISWADPELVLHKKLPLFGPISSPFSIKQSNVIVSNLLIVFQGLAEHPELLKNLIFKAEKQYYVKITDEMKEKTIWVDFQFPFFQQTFQPIFLSLDDQLWPMVMQKALCQFYNGYFQPGKVPLEKILYNITGNYCFQQMINPPATPEEMNILKKTISNLLSSNCIHTLISKTSCPLKTEEGRIECFSILKCLGDQYLINCPFKSQQIKQRQERQTRDMKLSKSHYTSSSSMVTWVSFDEFCQFFQKIIYCRSDSSSSKEQTLKISLCSNRIFVRFKTTENVDRPLFSFCFTGSKNGQPIIPKDVIGWKVNIFKKQEVDKIQCNVLGAVSADCLEGQQELLFMCEFEENIEKIPNAELILRYRNSSIVQAEALDAVFGDLQFIQCCKNFFNHRHDEYETPIIETIGEYLLIMTADKSPSYINLTDEGLSQQNIIEGLMTDGNTKLQLFPYKEIQFTVLMNISPQTIPKINILSLDQNESEPDSQDL